MEQEARADKMCGKGTGKGDWLGRHAISSESVEDSFAFGPELATGGFGSVRNLTEIRSKRQAYVCKSLSKTRSNSYSEDEKHEHIESVRREVQVYEILSPHHRILNLIQVYESSDAVHLVFKWCKHGELGAYLARQAIITVRDIRLLFKQAMEAVEHCHKHGIAHLDIKPSNFVVDEACNVYQIDFGLCSLQGREPYTGRVGTAAFMAPEMIAGNSAVAMATDIWSAGVILCVMLTGEMPFEGCTDEVKDQHANSIPFRSAAWHSTAWQAVPVEAKRVVKWMLYPMPNGRPTATQVLKNAWVQGPKTAEEHAIDNATLPGLAERIRQYQEKMGCMPLTGAQKPTTADSQPPPAAQGSPTHPVRAQAAGPVAQHPIEARQMPRVATNLRPWLRVRTPRQALGTVKAMLSQQHAVAADKDPQQWSNLMEKSAQLLYKERPSQQPTRVYVPDQPLKKQKLHPALPAGLHEPFPCQVSPGEGGSVASPAGFRIPAKHYNQLGGLPDTKAAMALSGRLQGPEMALSGERATVSVRQLQTAEMAEAKMAKAEMAEAEMAEAEMSSEHAEARKEVEIGLWEYDDSLLWADEEDSSLSALPGEPY